MLKKLLGDVKSVVGELFDEVNDEASLESYSCYLTVVNTTLDCFRLNEELTISFTEDIIKFESIEGDCFYIEIPISSIIEVAYRTTTLNNKPFTGSYLSFESESGIDNIYFKASSFEPHYFLECVQKMRILEDMNDKRYARTARPVKQLCEGCGAAIHEANCPHCGLTNTIERTTILESDYEYFQDPQYRATLQIHNTSLNHLSGDEKVFYHIYQDCISLRIRGTNNDYIPQNVVVLFENIIDFSLKRYDNTPENEGLFIQFRDNGLQHIQFKILSSAPKSPKVNLESIKSSFNLQEVFDAIPNNSSSPRSICSYCDMPIDKHICPYCGGIN